MPSDVAIVYSGWTRRSLELARRLADAALEVRMDRLDLGHDAEVALAVALGADHADRRLVDEARIGAELARDARWSGRSVPDGGR